MYLKRVLDKPSTRRNFQAARLFLINELCNRHYRIIDKRNVGGTRYKLTYKGLFFIYSPTDQRIYTIYPDGNSNERLEMKMRIPADFSVASNVNESLGKRTRAILFRRKWPVLTARGGPDGTAHILRLLVGKLLLDLDMNKRAIVGVQVFIHRNQATIVHDKEIENGQNHRFVYVVQPLQNGS